MKRFLFLVSVLGYFFISYHAFGVTYYFNKASGSWATAANWSPTRTTPATDDILLFDKNSTTSLCTANSIPTQQIGELKVINGCTAAFQASSGITLTVSTPGFAFLVDSTSQLIYIGTSQIIINLPILSTGTVQGDVVFNSGNGTVAHVLSSATANGIIFTNGASFQFNPTANNANNPFGSGTSNSIVFQSGATYYMSGNKTANSGFQSGDPFGGTGKSIASFQHGSLFYVYDPSDMSFSGRTVSNVSFDLRASGLSFGDSGVAAWVVIDTCRFKSTGTFSGTFSGTSPVKIGADFIIESGSGGLKDNPSLTTPTNFEVQGNFNQSTGSFTPSANVNRIYLLDGSSPQTLTLSASSTAIPNLNVNNSSGITLSSNVSIISTLSMAAGNINTGSNNFVLGVSTTQLGTLNRTSGTIIGKFTRWVSALTTGTYTFPIGTASNFNEATVNFSVPPTTGGTLTTFFTASNPGTLGLPTTDGTLSLNTINPSGFWTISTGNSSFAGGTYNLTLEANGFDLPSPISDARIVKRPNGASAWVDLGSAGTNSGVDIVRTGLSGFSDFGIAESNPSPSAGFTASPSSGNGPLPVTFTDTSLNNPTSWSWIFGDGNIGNTQNTTYTYAAVAAPTTYTVLLIVTNSFGTTTAMGSITVTEAAPSAGFTQSVLNTYGPLTVNFTDITVNENGAVTWSWTFGDGSTSSAQNPQHVYLSVSAPTTYTVFEIVSTSFGMSTASTAITVTEAGPTASFSKNLVNTYGPLTVNFMDTSSPLNGNSTTWSWTFGDGSTSSSQNPQHVYLSVPTTAQYVVQLVVTTPFGMSSSVTQTVTVTEAGPIAAFSPSPTSGYGALTVNFTNQSNQLNGSSTTWNWIFGDGQISSAENPTNVYAVVAAPTTYTAKLVVTTNFGMSTATTVITVTEPPPSVSSLQAPVDNSTTLNVPLLFSWSSATDSVGSSINYTLRLGLDTGFTSMITTIMSVSSTSYTIPSLSTGPVYWDIQANSVFGSSTSTTQQVIVYDTTDQRAVATSETVTFYLGNSLEGILPVTIVFNTTNADTVTITTMNTKAPGLPSNYYISRYWSINRLGSGALDAAVTFSYTTIDFNASGLSSETLLFPADSTITSTWSSLSTNGMGITRDTVNHTLTLFGLNEFSLWTLGGAGGVAVELCNFTAENDVLDTPKLKQ